MTGITFFLFHFEMIVSDIAKGELYVRSTRKISINSYMVNLPPF